MSVADDGELCGLCHKDVKMSKHSYCKMWMKDGHPVFVKPSEKVQVSAMFPLNEQGELTCETCHTPESAPSFEDQQNIYTGKLTLRYSNKDSFLCKQCHVREYDKKTQKEKSNHPSGTVMDKIPRALLEAGAISTKNKILCQTCHKVHQAKGDPLLIMPELYSELCGNCHPRYFAFKRGGATNKGTHPVDIIPVTASIAKTISNLGGKRGGSKKIICLTCHRIHQAPSKESLLITDRKVICNICHEQYLETVTGTKHDMRLLKPNLTDIRGKKAKDENVCTPCHLTHGGTGPKMWARPMSGEGNVISQLCTSCHAEGAEKGEAIAKTTIGNFSHSVGVQYEFTWGRTKLPLYNKEGLYSANKDVTCATCHNVHQWDPEKKKVKGKLSQDGTKMNSFLRAKNVDSKLCQICHPESFSIKGTTHDPFNDSFKPLRVEQEKNNNICEGCHLVHDAVGPRLWRYEPGDGDDAVSRICNTCHESEGIAQNKTVGLFSHPVDVGQGIDLPGDALPLFDTNLARIANGRVYCNTCHNVHDGPIEKQKKNGKKTANNNYLRMYGNQTDLLCSTCHQNEQFIKNTKHDLVTSSEKSQGLCARCHKVHNASAGFRLWYKPIVEDAEPSIQMCNQCHNKEGIAKKSLLEGHSHPIAVEMSKKDKKIELPLYDDHLKKRKRGNVLCPTCHNVHQWRPGKEEEKVTAKKGNYQDSFLRIVDDKGVELCLECHPNKQPIMESNHNLALSRPQEKNWVGQKTKNSGVCSACHMVHQASQGFSLWARKITEGPDKISELCQSCHAKGLCAAKKLTGANSHPINVSVEGYLEPAVPLFDPDGQKDQQKGKVACASCHDAHTPIEGSFLRVANKENTALCQECHPAKLAIAQSSHNLTKNETGEVCSSCHKIHNSETKLNLWSRSMKDIKYPKEWFLGMKVGKNKQNKYCISCHYSTQSESFTAYHPGNLFFPQLEIENGERYKDIPSFLYQFGEKKLTLYVEAINSGIRPRYPVFNKSGVVNAAGYMACPSCHDIHQNDLGDPKKKGLLRSKIDQNFCSVCHSIDAIYRYQYFHASSQKKAKNFNPFFEQKKKNKDPGPHFSKDRCRDCHPSRPSSASNAQILFEGDVVKLCESCHDGKKAVREKHPVNVEQAGKTDLPLKDNKVTCISCHDIKSEHSVSNLQKTNPYFLYENDSKPIMTYTWTLKETPLYSQNRYNLCYKCHAEGQYRQFSPHRRQLNRSKGIVNKDVCLICHQRVPNRKTDQVKDFQLKFKDTSVCTGCHPGKKTKHPLDENHFNVKVTPETGTAINRTIEREKVFIPIIGERISCFSCHNAHEKGVLRNSYTRKGEDAKGRIRFGNLDPCPMCHAQDYRIPDFEGGFSPW